MRMRAVTAAACVAAALTGLAACGGSSPHVNAAASHSASARSSASSSPASPESTRSRSASDITGKWTGSCNFPGLQFQDMQLNPDSTAVVGGSETAWATIEKQNPGASI